jgi:hypothetical protein
MFSKTVLILIVCSLVGCSTQPIEPKKLESKKFEIDAQQYGENWPLRVERGKLACEQNAVTFEADGIIYAINGRAQTENHRNGRGWANSKNIRRYDPQGVMYGLMDVGPLIQRGLALCEENGTN